MYNPHLTECGVCLEEFVDEQEVASWHEDYVCMPCAVKFIKNPLTHIWKKNPEKLFFWDSVKS